MENYKAKSMKNGPLFASLEPILELLRFFPSFGRCWTMFIMVSVAVWLYVTSWATNDAKGTNLDFALVGTSLNSRVLVGLGIEYKRVRGRLMVRRPETGKNFFGPCVWGPPALAGDFVARLD